MSVTIATLEAKARINRDQWNADKAAILADVQSLSQQLDQLGARTAAATRAPSGTRGAGAGAQSAPDAQPLNQAADATTRLSRAQREATDPAYALAQAINRAQRDVSLYTRTMGEAHPVTQQARASLESLQRAAGSGAQPVLTLSQHIRNLTQQMTTSGTAAADFGRGILQSVGGISLIAGGAAAAGAAVAGLIQQLGSMAAQAIKAGVAGNTSFEQYQVGFKVLLGGADAAQKRIAELSEFAQKTPFNLPEVVQADKVLQTFGGDTLATGRNLQLVGDIASGTNRSFQDVALWVGRAYDALQSGRPWGEAAMHLQEMAALSGSARARLEAMQASGASGAQIWAAFNQEMSRFNGLMDEQSKTAAGLASNLQDMIGAAERTATKPLFDNAKKQLETLTGDAAQSQMKQTANNLAAIFTLALPAANAFVSLGIAPVVKELNEISGALRNLNNLGGLGLFDTENPSQSILSLTKGAFGSVAKFVTDAIPPFEHFKDAAQRAAEAYRDYMSQIEMSNVQLHRRTGSDGGPVDPREGRIAPPPGGFGTIDTQIAAGNQMADDMSRLRVQAEVARQQAENQQYLTLQLTAQNAQAQAQAAMDRLKLSDQTFLQGQVSADIVATQLQTAITKMKLGNKQLQDVTIQSEIAQAQVNAAMSRARANNSTLIGVNVDADVAQTQLQTVITTAQGNSQAWINAQVASEKAQQDAQNKLDIARKAAGLIDETAEEKRQHERQITKVEFVKQQAEDAAAIIKAGIDSITNLQSIHVPTNIGSKIAQLTQFEDQVIAAEQQIASRFSKEQITQLYSFSQAANEGMGYFSTGVTALGQISTLRIPDASQVERVLKQADGIVAQINKTAATYKTEDIVQAGVYAEQAQKITGFLSSTADAFAKLLPQRTDIRGQINLFFENLNHALRDFSIYSKSFKAYATDTARDIADNVGAVMDNLNKALEPLTKFGDLLNLDDSTIDLGFASIQRALSKFSDLANSPMFQGTALDKLKNASDSLGSVFSGLKTMVDTLTGLTDLADPTGTVDLGGGIDLLAGSVTSLADTWEIAMTRIGNATAAAGRTVGSALGLPNAAGAGKSGAGGGGAAISITIYGGQDADIDALVERILRKQSLANGGVHVG